MTIDKQPSPVGDYGGVPPETIEANKNKLDLRPSVKFVEDHLALYSEGFDRIKEQAEGKPNFPITFAGKGEVTRAQISEAEIQGLLNAMPESLQKLSRLKTVSYFDIVAVPQYDEVGNFTGQLAGQPAIGDFPRVGDHPSRVLVGATAASGESVFMIPIPKTVTENAAAANYYQQHVFLHEFFHTIEMGRRDPAERKKVVLEFEGEEFTLEDWWQDFTKLILSDVEPEAISHYASVYKSELNNESAQNIPDKFNHALAEQMSETFVAYWLNVVSNDKGWTDFKAESFGNAEQAQLFQEGSVISANEKWQLMNKLCKANLVESK